MHTIFIKLYYLISKNKVISVVVALFMLLVLAYFSSKISFEEDITRIIPKSDRSDVTAKVLQQLNFSDKITVIFEKDKEGSVDDLTEMATVFLDSLHSCDQYINEVQGQVDSENIQETFDFVYNNLPLFLDDSDYKLINQRLAKDSISNKVESNYRTLISPTGIIARDFILNDPLGISFIGLKKLQQLNLGDDFHLEGGFVVTKDNSKLLLFINPKLAGSETEKNTKFIDDLNSIKENLNKNFIGKSSIDYFGASFIAVANAKQIKHDIQTTVMISIVVLVLILILFYRKLSIPVIIFVPTIFGALIALASLYFIKDSISAISISIGAILLGVTVDYSLHILTHYKHNSDIKILYKDITKPIIMSSCTTAISFLCLLFVHSEALKDLGIFAAISVLFAAVFSLIVIPHLYTPKSEPYPRVTLIDKIGSYSFHKNKFLIGFCLLIIVGSLFTFNQVKFNNNLSDLNFIPKELKDAEAKLETTTNLTSKSIYLATYGNSLEEVLKNNNALFNELNVEKNNNKILGFSSIGGIVLSDSIQQIKINKWNSFWSEERKSNLKNNFIEAGKAYGFKPETHQLFYELLNKDFQTISIKDYNNLKALFLEEFVSEKNQFYTISSVVKVSTEQRNDFVSTIEKNKSYIAIDRQHMNETFLGKLKSDFSSLINYSLIAVFVILFLFFRRIELAILSALPIIVTGIVTAGAMVFFDIQLNIFSTIVCTLIFGIGVDFSIFMTSALQKEYTTGQDVLASYRTSILLAVLTTVLAIGTLIFAEHPALKSISAVSLIGIFAAVIITFVFYPILFKICISNRPKKGKSPISLRLLVHSTLSFIYYGLGGFVFSILGKIILFLIPAKGESKMLWFRLIISKFMKSVLYSNPFVKKQIINPHHEKFDKPAVIISNHTSFLDILAAGMVTPKMIYLVNDWVYNSPIFGRVVKLAGYYPVSQGVEGSVNHLKEKIDKGYSLMVFPEGTRSDDNLVKRFHKGSFYLAEQFNLDVLPLYIHGNSETLPKGDHIIYDGSISVIIGDRIKANDSNFGSNYSERTKKINSYFRKEFTIIRNEIEDQNYFKSRLFLSFLYKENDVVTSVKKDFQANKATYYAINKYVDIDAKILHIGNDYGQIDVLLTLQEPKRKIQSYINFEENRSVANHNYLAKKRKITYINNLSDAEDTNDTLLISPYLYIDSESLVVNACLKTVILLNYELLLNRFSIEGFKIIHQEQNFVVLKKE
jgi:uncharacterized protein